ncbi:MULTISPECIES: rhodanese-like domain-containing protein [Spirulina sp. CCY15215]|uniref:rhodanese-like domain-containing protein n=1 Tax=Spirulina sp. CCY15215 TaxID=2767591 RepID=UPI001950F12C
MVEDPQSKITVEELAQRMVEKSEILQLIDVREPEEIAIAHIAGFEVLPLSQFNDWSEDIKQRFNTESETLVLCHHGMRSAQMCQWLRSQGFTNVKNITGGIEAYACLVDASLPRY